MKAQQLSQLCINGSQSVYDFVSKRRYGGAQEIAVEHIERVDDNEFKFKLSRTIFDLDSITFLFSDGERRYFENDEISIMVYDQDQRFVIIKTNTDVAKLIDETQARPNAWTLVFDLKFLIKRVIEWYDKNGNDLIFTQGRSASRLTFDPSVIFDNAKPSKEQMAAISLSFNAPLSYIWGAPGTGKTRFVLSYALLTYIKHDAKALILAPTNLALEQIFRGVIDVVEQAGIDKRQLLRIGTPTKGFATDHGQVCEDKGLDVKLAQLDRQIGILESIQKIDQLDQSGLEAMLSVLETLDVKQKLVRKTTVHLSQLKHQANTNKKSWETTRTSIKSHERMLAKTASKSPKHRALSESLQTLVTRQTQQVTRLKGSQQTIDQLERDLSALKKIVQKEESSLQTMADKSGVKEDDLSLQNIRACKQDSLNKRARLFSMAQEYEQFAEHEMGAKLKQYQSDRTTLESHSTKARLITANVIGMTLDSFIARTKEKPLSVDHVFIDEASYASAVKVLPAFITKGPITMLGDHKQLQPVCELNRDDIIKQEANNGALAWDLSAIHCESLWRAESLNDALYDYQNHVPPVFDKLQKRALTSSFRFGKKLARVLDSYVYTEEGFHSALDSDTKLSVFNVKNKPYFGEREIRREQAIAHREPVIGKRANMGEAQCVAKILQKGLIEGHDFAVLTPYRDQVSLIDKLVPELLDSDRLLTVHKSQGREWHTVIYSVCDIGNGAAPWFTDSNNAMSGGLSNVNTAVSRAKQHLIIVCDCDAWEVKKTQLISGLIQARSQRYQYQDSPR